jgi:hypothetical protein
MPISSGSLVIASSPKGIENFVRGDFMIFHFTERNYCNKSVIFFKFCYRILFEDLKGRDVSGTLLKFICLACCQSYCKKLRITRLVACNGITFMPYSLQMSMLVQTLEGRVRHIRSPNSLAHSISLSQRDHVKQRQKICIGY